MPTGCENYLYIDYIMHILFQLFSAVCQGVLGANKSVSERMSESINANTLIIHKNHCARSSNSIFDDTLIVYALGLATSSGRGN